MEEFLNSEIYKELCELKGKDNYWQYFYDRCQSLDERYKLEFYINLIDTNNNQFEDKNVLVINSQLGYIPLLLKKVNPKNLFVLVENNSQKYWLQRIFKMNGQDIKCVESLDDVKEKIDTIFSDSFGSFGINSKSVTQVIEARDKLLTKDGAIIPDKIKYFIAGITDSEFYEERFGYWNDVYGYKMSCMRDLHFKDCFFDFLKAEHLITDKQLLLEINLSEIKKLSFLTNYKLKSNSRSELNGVGIWFNVLFSKAHFPIMMSSNPEKNKENFYHGVFYIKKPVMMNKKQYVSGQVAFQLGEKPSMGMARITYNLSDSKYHADQFYTINQFK